MAELKPTSGSIAIENRVWRVEPKPFSISRTSFGEPFWLKEFITTISRSRHWPNILKQNRNFNVSRINVSWFFNWANRSLESLKQTLQKGIISIISNYSNSFKFIKTQTHTHTNAHLPSAMSIWARTNNRYASESIPKNLVCEHERLQDASNLGAFKRFKSASSSCRSFNRASDLHANSCQFDIQNIMLKRMLII